LAKKIDNNKTKDNEKAKSEPMGKKFLLSKPMGKRFLMIIALIVILSIIGFVWSTTLNPDMFADVSTSESKAQLFIRIYVVILPPVFWLVHQLYLPVPTPLIFYEFANSF